MKTIEQSVERAIDFVLASRNKDGMWYNFLTRHHGESADWVTSFAGLNLIYAEIPKKELEKTAKSVLKRQRKDGGFSYNHKIVPDADSTSFAVRFLTNFGYEHELSNAKYFLSQHQNKDGGFGTYREGNIRQYFRIPKDMPVEGWCMSNLDITSSALLVNPNKRAIGYILKNQQEDGRWRSYWWNSDVYATAHCIDALSDLNLKQETFRAREWLAEDKNIPESAFYIALSIQALSSNPKYRKIIEKRVDSLLKMQRKDGSWNTTPILRFPLPLDKNPWKTPKRWRPDAKDQNRIFTSSTCIRALTECKRNL